MENEQTIFLKEDFKWHYLAMCLDSIKGILPINDDVFEVLFQDLRDYVDEKILPPVGGELIDMYVVVERKIKPEYN